MERPGQRQVEVVVLLVGAAVNQNIQVGVNPNICGLLLSLLGVVSEQIGQAEGLAPLPLSHFTMGTEGAEGIRDRIGVAGYCGFKAVEELIDRLVG
jgi:hypothetical protein